MVLSVRDVHPHVSAKPDCFSLGRKAPSPQLRMRSIAIGWGAGLFAGAKGNGFFGLGGEGEGFQRCDFMGAIAKRLIAGVPAAAPIIGFARC